MQLIYEFLSVSAALRDWSVSGEHSMVVKMKQAVRSLKHSGLKIDYSHIKKW